MDRAVAPPQLEPLGFGELLDAGFRLWRRNFGKFSLIALIATAPIAIVQFFFLRSQIQLIEAGQVLVDDPDAFNRTAGLITLASLVSAAVSFGAMYAMATRRYVGQQLTAGNALKDGLKRFFPFLITWLIYLLAVGLGLVALVIPGLFLGVSLFLAFPAFWAERAGPFRSLRRSWALVKGRRWVLLGVIVLGFLLLSLLSFLATGPAVLAGDNVALFAALNGLVVPIYSAVLTPILPVMGTVSYYDARVRKEGFDIELASRGLIPQV